ncbi:MAG TPA: hypothetical protein VFB60_10395 [Ktedonobacteraceae bacterium]|nr:hypothetical protein [Ktedonobacteraceae bacterium]
MNFSSVSRLRVRMEMMVRRASQKSLHALTARATGAHRERKVLAVGCAHSQHLPLPNGSQASRSE